jgi:hypothetical protein
MVITLAMVAGLYTLTSYQSSYDSLINADNSESAIFCPSIDFDLDNSVSQDKDSGNTETTPSEVFVSPNPNNNGSKSTETVNCNNTASTP